VDHPSFFFCQKGIRSFFIAFSRLPSVKHSLNTRSVSAFMINRCRISDMRGHGDKSQLSASRVGENDKTLSKEEGDEDE